mgnify:CR=1 FL=1
MFLFKSKPSVGSRGYRAFEKYGLKDLKVSEYYSSLMNIINKNCDIRNEEELKREISILLGLNMGNKLNMGEENKEFIEAHADDKRWVINVQGIKRGRKQTLPVKLSEVIKHIDDVNTHYSIAFNDSLAYRRQWNEIPEVVKNTLHMSVILADKKGNIVEI